MPTATFSYIIQNPSGIVPLLSDEDIYATIVGSIRAYVDQKITLSSLIDICTKIKLFSGFRKNNNLIDKALRSLTSMVNFLNNEKSNKDKINETLVNILNSLAKKS